MRVIECLILLLCLCFPKVALSKEPGSENVAEQLKSLSEIEQEFVQENCLCKDQDEAQVKKFNKDFLDKQIQRLNDDIKEFQGFHSKREAEVKTRLNSISASTKEDVDQDWQLKSIKLFIDQKREALKRAQNYQKQSGAWPNVRLHVQDLYADFNFGNCIDPMLRSRRTLHKMLNLENNRRSFTKKLSRACDFATPPQVKWNKQRCQSDQKKIKLNRMRLDSDSETEGLAFETCTHCDLDEMKIQEVSKRAKYLTSTLADECKTKSIVNCTDSPEDFLKALKADRAIAKPSYLSPFSSPYSKPDNQGVPIPKNASTRQKEELKSKATSACVGFAIKNDLEGILYKKTLEGTPLPPADPWEIYSTVIGESKGKDCKGFRKDRYYDDGVRYIHRGLNELNKNPLCLPGVDARVRVTGAVALYETEQIDFNFFKQLIDRDLHPMVLLTTEGGEDREQWIQPGECGVPHMAQVVGYGEGVNPATLKKEPYLIMRDSIYTDPVHRWMSFNDLKSSLTGVMKINKVDIVEDPEEK